MTLSTMFPIIPQHLAGRPTYPSSASKRPQVTVIAARTIPAHARTPVIPIDDVVQMRLSKNKYELELNSSGELEESEGSVAWVRHAKVSPDCHSFNVLVSVVIGQSAIYLRTVRELQAGEEVCLWYDQDTITVAGIPFLTPCNIQGEKKYICHKCGKHFEYPNPLKIHLSLECGTLRRIELWKNLARTVKVTKPSRDLNLLEAYDMKLPKTCSSLKDASKPEHGPALSSPEKLSSPVVSRPFLKSEEELNDQSENNSERYSAFKPYLSLESTTKDQKVNTMVNPFQSLLPVPSNLIFSTSTFFSPHNIPCTPVSPFPVASFASKSEDQQAVEVETLVSNLGRSKQGHLCIYCGKVYSRKYGLKIHIRTHTGFKPLKCKFCLRPFGDPSNLNKHVRLHAEGETPYRCEECGKILVRRRDLERHMKSRHTQDCS